MVAGSRSDDFWAVFGAMCSSLVVGAQRLFLCARVDFRRVAGSRSNDFRAVFGAMCTSLVVGAQRPFLFNVQELIFVWWQDRVLTIFGQCLERCVLLVVGAQRPFLLMCKS